jgi:predicted nucleic acid-binding protein
VIVVDASAMVEALVGLEADGELLDALVGDPRAPHLIDVEVLSVLRGLMLAGKLDRGAAADARRDHFAFTSTSHEVQPLVDRVWKLRHQYTSYDACYLALADALETPLYTCHGELHGDGHGAEVRVFPRTR